jgi:hypothetical protein
MPSCYVASKSQTAGRWYRTTKGRAANHIEQQNFMKALIGDQFNPGIDPDVRKSRYDSNFVPQDDDTEI